MKALATYNLNRHINSKITSKKYYGLEQILGGTEGNG